jgi:hypothetical protein
MYSATQPSSLQNFYGENSIIDFIIKMKPNKGIVPGSLRISGDLNISTSKSPEITLHDKIHLDAFSGVHGLFRSVNTQVQNISIENVQSYGRIVSMMAQAKNDLDTLNTSSLVLSELRGTTNSFQLIGNKVVDGKNCVSFSMLPQVSLNMANGILGSDKFSNIQMSFTMANAVEALYTSHKPLDPYMTNDDTKFTSIDYKLYNVLLSWVEVDVTTATGAIVMPVKHLYTQTINSESSFLSLTAPALYNSISVSFLQQSKRNSIFHNNLQCEKLFGIDQVGGGLDLVINGTDTVVPFTIQDYNMIAQNYIMSLNGDMNKNSIMNKMLENQTFGIGFSLLTSSNDRLAIQLKMNSTDYLNQIPKYDTFIFINSFVQM